MGTKTILLADDEAHITCVVADKLRVAGFAVVTARDGEEAFELASRVRPDLVVTDLQMPRMSGLELAAKLRAFEPTSGTPVIMLTARGYILDQGEVARTNIKCVMSKPFSAKAVVKQVAELLGVTTPAAAPVGGREAA
jgi:DNA-binding response OmpR family regulator